jgi:hypothetical protein
MIQACPNIKTVKEETGTDWQQIGLKTLAILLVPGPEDGVGGTPDPTLGVVPTPDPGMFGGAGEGRAGFAVDGIWKIGGWFQCGLSLLRSGFMMLVDALRWQTWKEWVEKN